MEVVKCSDEIPTISKNFGYTIKHNQPIGWMGSNGPYIGWYRYKRDAIARLKELKKTL